MAPRSLSRVARPASSGARGGCRSESALAPPPGAAVVSAATRYVQNNAGSLSRRSSESHATDRPSAGAAASHSASSVVLPNPAGADTSVSAESAPRLRRSLSLGRATRTSSPPGDVELGLEQWACHDHRPSGASLHMPSRRTRRQPHNGWLRLVPAGRPRPSGHVIPPYAESWQTWSGGMHLSDLGTVSGDVPPVARDAAHEHVLSVIGVLRAGWCAPAGLEHVGWCCRSGRRVDLSGARSLVLDRMASAERQPP